jgi:starvation-inducible DNA-binding protein
MSNINTIGLDAAKSAQLAEKLNVLLANYQLFYINLRGFHWNIKGEKFFELHLKFEELYNDAIIKIDEIAERILTLGHTPLHSFSDYLAHTSIKEAKNLSDGQSTVKSVLDSLQKLLVLERELLEMSGDAGDEGTNALMSDYIREQEKTAWMYNAFLGR